MSAYGLGLDLGMTSITAAVARGQTVEVATTTGDANRVSTPAVAYAARGVVATGVEAQRRAIGSPDRVAVGVLDNLARQVPVVIQDASYPRTPSWGPWCTTLSPPSPPTRGEPPGRLTMTQPAHWSREQISASSRHVFARVQPAHLGAGLRKAPGSSVGGARPAGGAG